MLNISQFRELIVKSTLKDLLLYSEDAEELMVFTCAVKSLGGSILTGRNGSCLGIYQLDPLTYNNLWQHYLKNETRLCLILCSNFDVHFQPPIERLIYDLRFASAMTMLHYASFKEPLPDSDDENAMWEYYNSKYDFTISKEIAIKRYHDFVQR